MRMREVFVNFGTTKREHVDTDYIITELILFPQFLVVKFESNVLDPDEALKLANRVNKRKEFLKIPLFKPGEFEYAGECASQLIFKKKSWNPKKGCDIELPSGHIIHLIGVTENNEEHFEYLIEYLLKQGERLYNEENRIILPKDSDELLELLGICFMKAYLSKDVDTSYFMLSNYYNGCFGENILVFGSPGK